MSDSNPHGRLSRREWLASAAATAVALSLPCSESAAGEANSGEAGDELWVYVGTYTDNIHIYRLDAKLGALRAVGTAKGARRPSYLAIAAQQGILYAVNELEQGAVTAFAIDRQTGELRKLNQQTSQGNAPCYVSVDPSGKFVLVANYGDGVVSVLPITKAGGLGAAVSIVRHRGSGKDPGRQAGPHAHCIVPDRSGRYVFAVDLGIDKVLIYRLDSSTGKLTPNSQPAFQTQPGAGPRHFAVHPSGKFAYVINELDSSVTALACDSAAGTLQELQTLSTLPAGFAGTNFPADLHVHPSGQFLYGSNRGHNSIVAFSVDAVTGKLSLLAHEPTRGNFPRNFGIDPSGRILIAANQYSNTMSVFRIDRGTGRLSAVGDTIQVPKPVCVKFFS
jgi:6-phosphogluconolactonase